MEFGVRETFKAFKTSAWYNVDTHVPQALQMAMEDGRMDQRHSQCNRCRYLNSICVRNFINHIIKVTLTDDENIDHNSTKGHLSK